MAQTRRNGLSIWTRSFGSVSPVVDELDTNDAPFIHVHPLKAPAVVDHVVDVAEDACVGVRNGNDDLTHIGILRSPRRRSCRSRRQPPHVVPTGPRVGYTIVLFHHRIMTPPQIVNSPSAEPASFLYSKRILQQAGIPNDLSFHPALIQNYTPDCSFWMIKRAPSNIPVTFSG